ncbi:hypothetical protein ACOACO_08465 [Nocardioides sp. CPCC 205120]|uniref:hypothetical protein n=1 Tax=Nocardioides sp. CPCC 205120 TaxID=3406462 RepID=UPI003B51045A
MAALDAVVEVAALDAVVEVAAPAALETTSGTPAAGHQTPADLRKLVLWRTVDRGRECRWSLV